MRIETGDLVKIKSLGYRWFSVEDIDYNEKTFLAGYSPSTLEWNGKWFNFNDVTDRTSMSEQYN